MNVQRMLSKAYSETRRILRLTRKPKNSEYKETARITGAGIVIIGFIGFVILLVAQIIQK